MIEFLFKLFLNTTNKSLERYKKTEKRLLLDLASEMKTEKLLSI